MDYEQLLIEEARRESTVVIQEEVHSFWVKLSNVDIQLLTLFEERQRLTRNVGIIKDEYRIVVTQDNRWQQVIENITLAAERLNLPTKVICGIWTLIHNDSIDRQKAIDRYLNSNRINTPAEAVLSLLTELRTEIDAADVLIVELIGKKIELTNKLIELRKSVGIDINRDFMCQVVQERISLESEKLGLPKLLITNIWDIINQYSINVSKTI